MVAVDKKERSCKIIDLQFLVIVGCRRRKRKISRLEKRVTEDIEC